TAGPGRSGPIRTPLISAPMFPATRRTSMDNSGKDMRLPFLPSNEPGAARAGRDRLRRSLTVTRTRRAGQSASSVVSAHLDLAGAGGCADAVRGGPAAGRPGGSDG